MTKYVHDDVRIDAKRFTKVTDFIGIPDLKGMPAVVDVLDHFRSLYIRPDKWGFELFVKLRQGVATGPIQLTNYGLGWTPKVFDRRSFAQKFWVVANAKVDRSFLPRKLFQGEN